MSSAVAPNRPRLLISVIVSLVVASFCSFVAGQAVINSPASLTECLPQLLSISGGTPPYVVQVLPGGATGGTPLETLPTIPTTGSVTWLVDLASGQNVTFAVRDNTGAINYSSSVAILPGTSTSCVGTNPQNGTASVIAATATARAARRQVSLTPGGSVNRTTDTVQAVAFPTYVQALID